MSPLEFVIVALATWRLTHILLRESGPWGLFRRLRQALGVVYDPQDDTRVVAFRYEITTCMWCLSMWTSQLAVFGYAVFVHAHAPLGLFTALATGAAISAVCVALDHLFGMR